MKEVLVNHLACPSCLSPLALADPRRQGGEIVEGRLCCRQCRGVEFPIRGGIPRVLKGADVEATKALTQASFSEKWKRARHYRQIAGGFYTQWFLDRYGFADRAALEAFLRGMSAILDAGTGTGRDTEMYATASEAQVFGIDLSLGVEHAYADLGRLGNAHFLQADLTWPPFRDGSFDLVSCDQVIHHTPDTRASLARLVRLVRPGGWIAFYVYRRKGPIREFCDDYLRAQTTRMSEEACLEFSRQITALGRSLAEMKVTVTIPVDIPLLGLTAGQVDLQRFFHWHAFKCFWNPAFDWDTNVMVNFDWYHPTDAHRHTPDEVRAWCRDLGIVIRHWSEVEAGISVLGQVGRSA